MGKIHGSYIQGKSFFFLLILDSVSPPFEKKALFLLAT